MSAPRRAGPSADEAGTALAHRAGGEGGAWVPSARSEREVWQHPPTDTVVVFPKTMAAGGGDRGTTGCVAYQGAPQDRPPPTTPLVPPTEAHSL